MEAAASWDGACQFQLANWSVEEPAAVLPPEYASIDIPDVCGIQAYEYESYEYDVQLQQQLVQYYSSASRPPPNIISTSETAKISNDSHAKTVVKEVVGEFKADMSIMENKMHRYPACLGAVHKCYRTPRIVAIGPYHHDLEHLKPAEKVKHVAACHCIGEFQLLEEVYEKFVPIADEARCFYDKDVMAGISYDDFRHMMFFDACFLVHYMAMQGTSHRDRIDGSLQRFLSPNRIDVFHDIMLLENQIPWTVVEKVLSFVPDGAGDPKVPSIPKKFVHLWRYCMQPDDHRDDRPNEGTSFDSWDDNYTPPHFLGLLRYYIVGQRRHTDDKKKKKKKKKNKPDDEKEKKTKLGNISYFISAIDLAEIGITLKANKTLQLIDMHLNEEGAVFTDLTLAPLSLDRDRASYLVSMAALELCMVESFGAKTATYEVSAVCSYLLLLANLVYREEDVQELRDRGVLQRGGGLTNAEALAFFTSVHGLRFGPCYRRIMKQIKRYRDNSPIKTKLHGFVHKNKKTITALFTGVGVVGGIIGTLLSIKESI